MSNPICVWEAASSSIESVELVLVVVVGKSAIDFGGYRFLPNENRKLCRKNICFRKSHIRSYECACAELVDSLTCRYQNLVHVNVVHRTNYSNITKNHNWGSENEFLADPSKMEASPFIIRGY